MYHCVDCEQYLIAFLKSVAVTHRARCNLRSSVFFSDYRNKGRAHDHRLRASCCETWDTRVLAGETLVAVARDEYDPTNVKKNKIVLAIQSNNGGFVFVFFLPYSPVVSHAMSNLDFSTMEDWLTAFMVWILALFVLLLCFGIFSLLRKNSFLSEKLVIGSITHKPLQKNPDL